MYQRIVVPLDGSNLAEAILPVVGQLAGGLRATVELLAVVDRDAVAPGKQPFSDDVSRNAANKALAYLQGVAGRVAVPRERVKATVVVNRVAQGIAEAAESQPNTVIAMSTHGRSGIGRFAMGSVASGVLNGTRAPVLLYRSREGSAPAEKLAAAVVPLDGSMLAEAAVAAARDLAKALSLSVLLVRVRQTLSAATAGAVFDWHVPQLYDEEAATVSAYLAVKEDELKKAGLTVSSRVLEGAPAGAIIDLVKAMPNALVIMSSHGRSGAGRAIMGSVADRVVSNANAPVLLLRA